MNTPKTLRGWFARLEGRPLSEFREWQAIKNLFAIKIWRHFYDNLDRIEFLDEVIDVPNPKDNNDLFRAWLESKYYHESDGSVTTYYLEKLLPVDDSSEISQIPEKACGQREYWNYRVLAHFHAGVKLNEERTTSDTIVLSVHEVHYKSCKPVSYSSDAITISTTDEEDNMLGVLSEQLVRIKKALKKSILWAGERFPQVYELPVVKNENVSNTVENKT